MLRFEFSTQVINNQSKRLLTINLTYLIGNQLFKTHTRLRIVCIKHAFATL